MRIRSRIACISAAITALMCGSRNVWATDLTWDADPGTAGVQDGNGTWDTSTSSNWYDGANNVLWNNANPDSAQFGSDANAITTATTHIITITEPVVAQNIVLSTATDGASYNIFDDFSAGSLTINGNVTKSSGVGNLQFFMGAPVTLSSGDHVFKINDTAGTAPELTINAVLTGDGGVTLDNTSYQTFGTLRLNLANSYNGVTNVTNGQLMISDAAALGSTSAGTNIGALGTLTVNLPASTPINLTEPITITRDTYSGGEFARYTDALIFSNTGPSQNHTISGPLKINSTDARISVNTNNLTISSTITTDIANPTLTLDGDFAGFVNLTADNTAALATGGIKLIGGVQLDLSNENQIGGASAPITFAGNATLHPIAGVMTNFGSHPLNNASFSGGISVDDTFTFTIDQALGQTSTAVGTLGKRGLGTMNINSVVNLRGGQSFWDAGVVNVNNSVTLHSLHLRSPTVNIGTGGSVTMSVAFNSFGQDSTGTNGGPDKAIVNITGNGQLVQNTPIANNVDFNISDNANTEGTINLMDNGVLSTTGLVHVGKSAGGKGTINQTGGTFTLTRPGNFTLVLGSRNGTGTYTMSGGTMTSAGEFYVGQGPSGTGVFNMSAGTINQNNWFVMGREGGTGTADLSGTALFIKGGAGTHTEIDSAAGIGPASLTIENSAEYRANNGDFRIGTNSGADGTVTLKNSGKVTVALGETWVGNAGGGKGTLNLQDSATMTVNNWFAIGRGGALGTFNMSGTAAFTKQGSNNAYVGESNNTILSSMTLSGNAVYTGSTGEFWVGQGGGNGTFNIQGNASFTNNNWVALGRASGSSIGVINLSGGTFTKQGSNFLAIGSGGSGTFNQTGGVLNSNGTRLGEASNGTANLSGGTATFTGQFSLGHNGGVFGTLNVSNTANVTVPNVVFGNNAGTGGGTINLNGGTLTGASFTNGAGTGNKVFNFNGGTLKPSASTATFMQGLSSANVQNGGAVIDSNGFNVTIGQSLVTAGTGGLIKSGAGTVNLAGTNTYTGNTTVNAGTLVVSGKNLASPVHDATGGNIQLSGNTAVIRTGTVNTTASTVMDVNDGKLALTGETVAGVTARVLAGRNGGNWDGTNAIITSQSSAKVVNGMSTTLAVASAGAANVNKTTFGGVSVAPADTLVMYTYNGDANFSGNVDADDYFIIDSNYGKPVTGFNNGDFTYDNVIDGDDFAAIDAGFSGQGAPIAPAAGGGGGVTAVPEPASLGLFGLAAVGLIRRRRQAS